MKLKLIVLRCGNIEKSKEFYSSLGMKFTKEKHGFGPVHFSSEFNGLVFELYPVKSKKVDNLRLGLEIPDLVKIVNKLNILEEYEYNSVTVRVIVDPDGRKIELYGYVP